jgi:hypothetical protein
VLTVIIEDLGEAVSFQSPTPFQAISRGDLFDTTGWKIDRLRGQSLRVDRIEHVVDQAGDDQPATHQVRVSARVVKGDREEGPRLWDDPAEDRPERGR